MNIWSCICWSKKNCMAVSTKWTYLTTSCQEKFTSSRRMSQICKNYCKWSSKIWKFLLDKLWPLRLQNIPPILSLTHTQFLLNKLSKPTVLPGINRQIHPSSQLSLSPFYLGSCLEILPMDLFCFYLGFTYALKKIQSIVFLWKYYCLIDISLLWWDFSQPIVASFTMTSCRWVWIYLDLAMMWKMQYKISQ